jgi:thioredoxin reductase (NADPH)
MDRFTLEVDPVGEAQIVIYGAHWCPDCRRSKKFLSEQLVDYRWVDIEAEPEAEATVTGMNNGKRIIPTIVFPDGSFMSEPTNAQIARKLGLKTETKSIHYDLIIIGGGPAGLTAAIYAAREGAETLLVERSALGGQAAISGGIENFPGFPEGISGQEFAERITQQAQRFGVEILQAKEVTDIQHDMSCFCIRDEAGKQLNATAFLVATGATYRRLDVPGEDDYIGAGVHFCATCDGPFYRGAGELVVVGGGNSAAEEALHLTRFAERVTMLVRGERLTASRIAVDKLSEPNSRIQIFYNTVVEAFEGKKASLQAIKIRNRKSGEASTLHPAAAFIYIGLHPNSGFIKDLVALDEYGYILTGHDLYDHMEENGSRFKLERRPMAFETSMPGVFAAGDVRHGSTNQVASAVGEGAAAALSIREYLRAF